MEALPAEIIAHIARACTAEALRSLSCACTASRDAIAPVKTELWKGLTLERFPRNA